MDTYEKKYKEALERAKEKRDEYKRLDGEKSFVPSDIEYIFPELKESEDERIRKELIEQVIYIVPDKNEVDDNGNTLPCYTTRINKYIAWLEKQKPSDEALQYLKENHSPSDVSDFQAAMNIAVAKAFDAGKKAQKPVEWSEEDEKIRKNIIEHLQYDIDNMAKNDNLFDYEAEIEELSKYIAWLEKQEEQNPTPYTEIRNSVCREIAVSLIKYIDNNRHEGNMDLSSIECEDLENAVVNSDWQKVYNYMSKKLEKQGEQKEIDYNEELKKCKANPLYFFDKYVKTKEQKPAWSEEDELKFKDVE